MWLSLITKASDELSGPVRSITMRRVDTCILALDALDDDDDADDEIASS